MRDAISRTDARGDLYFCNAERADGNPGSSHWDLTGFLVNGPVKLLMDCTPWVVREVQPMLLPFSVIRMSSFRNSGGFVEELLRGEDTHLFWKLGLGAPGCAVAVIGGLVTSDGSGASRITTNIDGSHPARWRNAVVMYRDLLHRRQHKTRDVREILEDRLVESYWRLGRVLWTTGARGEALKALARCLVSSPRSIPMILRKCLAGPRAAA